MSLIVVNCKYTMCKIRPDEARTFISKSAFQKIFLLVLLISFSVDSAMSPIIVNVLDTQEQFWSHHLLFCIKSASYDGTTILTRDNKKFLLELKQNLLIMINHLSIGTFYWLYLTYLKGSSTETFLAILFACNSCHVILIEWTFLYFAIFN